MWEQVTHAIRGGQYSAPKTILGFLGTIYLLGVSFALGAIVALASSGREVWLIPVVILLVVVGTVSLIWSVLHLAQKDPTPLVVGQMTGGDFTAHQKMLKMGDSTTGELIEQPGIIDVVPKEATDEEDATRVPPRGKEE
jgi:uncharacterized transporter YbjL